MGRKKTHYLLARLVPLVLAGALVELTGTTLSTELEGFVSLSGGSLRFSANNNYLFIY